MYCLIIQSHRVPACHCLDLVPLLFGTGQTTVLPIQRMSASTKRTPFTKYKSKKEVVFISRWTANDLPALFQVFCGSLRPLNEEEKTAWDNCSFIHVCICFSLVGLSCCEI